jgi:ribonuclease P protein component
VRQHWIAYRSLRRRPDLARAISRALERNRQEVRTRSRIGCVRPCSRGGSREAISCRDFRFLAAACSEWSCIGETNISTEQARAQAQARVSRAHGDGRRTQGHRRSAGPRPQAAVRLRAASPSCAEARPRDSVRALQMRASANGLRSTSRVWSRSHRPRRVARNMPFWGRRRGLVQSPRRDSSRNCPLGRVSVPTKLSDAVSAKPEPRLDAAPPAIERLTRRKQFLNAAKGKRCHASAFTLQSAPSERTAPAELSRATSPSSRDGRPGGTAAAQRPGCGTAPRFGITVTKKIGGAVVRNRIRRRLKEALRDLVPLPARHGHDYVIVARRETLGTPFALLKESLAKALIRIDRIDGASSRSSKAHPPRKNRTGEAPQA